MADVTRLDLWIPDTHDPKKLGIADISMYASGITITNPTIEITPPAFPKVTLPFSSQSINIFNSNHLGLSCVGDPADLVAIPDGIWKVKFSIAPTYQNFVEKTFIRVDQVKQQLELIFLKTDISQCDDQLKQDDLTVILNAWGYIQGAIAAANKCNEALAMKFYNMAVKSINNLNKIRCYV